MHNVYVSFGEYHKSAIISLKTVKQQVLMGRQCVYCEEGTEFICNVVISGFIYGFIITWYVGWNM
jgi:hypothetical protein